MSLPVTTNKPPLPCVICGTIFKPRYPAEVTCSLACGSENHRRVARKHKARLKEKRVAFVLDLLKQRERLPDSAGDTARKALAGIAAAAKTM